MLKCNKLDALIARGLYRLALVIHDYPIPFLVVPLVLSIGLGSGIYYKAELEMLDVEQQYTPVDGPSHYEKRVAESFWPVNPLLYIPGRSVDLKTTLQIIVRARDAEDLTRPGYMTEIDQFNDFIVNEIYVERETNSLINRDEVNDRVTEGYYTDYSNDNQVYSNGNEGYSNENEDNSNENEGYSNENEDYSHENQVYSNGDEDNSTATDYYFYELNDTSLLYDENYDDYDNNRNAFYYTDLCMRFEEDCSFTNSHTFVLDYLIKHRNESKYASRLTYPRMQALPGSVPLYIGSVVGGVETKPENASLLESFRTIYLVYYLRYDTEEFAAASAEWELQVVDLLESYMSNDSSLLDIAYLYSDSLPQGLIQNERVLVPKFSISFALLIAFATCTTMKIDRQMRINWVESKQALALAGVLTAGMAIVSALGLLLHCGLEYVAITSVMPFLIISIGVDDMFIMISSWRRTSPETCLRTRLAETLADSSVSITITSVTSLLSFAVGSYSSINAIKHFCLYSSVAIAINYVYQITFFVACMVYAGKAEEQGRNGLVPCLKHKTNRVHPNTPTVETNGHSKELSANGDSNNNKTNGHVHLPPQTDDVIVLFFRNKFGPFLLKPVVKAFVLVVIVVYLATAAWGVSKVRQGLNLQSIYLRDFHAVKYFDFLDKYVWPQGVQLEVVVSNPPEDLHHADERAGLVELVSAFENTRYSSDRNFTDFWLFEYYQFLDDSDVDVLDNPVVWTRHLYDWTHLNFILKTYSQDFSWRNSTEEEREVCKCDFIMKAFRFRIGMKDFSDVENQRRGAYLMRSIAERFPQYNVTTYAQYWPFMDQYLVIVPTLLQNISLALASVIICSLVFIPSPIGVVWITVAIISIDIGVIGYMTHWGVNLDAISMICIIMSIGLSVDYTAHIAYGYVAAKGTPDEKAIEALEVLGLPVIQGALSSVIGVVVLGFIPSYLVQVFFKTIILVVMIGMVHACVFLPVLFSVSGHLLLQCKKLFKTNSEEPAVVTVNGEIAKATNGTAAQNNNIQVIVLEDR